MVTSLKLEMTSGEWTGCHPSGEASCFLKLDLN